MSDGLVLGLIEAGVFYFRMYGMCMSLIIEVVCTKCKFYSAKPEALQHTFATAVRCCRYSRAV